MNIFHFFNKNPSKHLLPARSERNSSHSDETGRSMLEMLGVLALMGLLAASGFAGLGYVMDGWRSQEIQEAAAQTRALLVSNKVSLTGTSDSLNTFVNKTSLRRYTPRVEQSLQNDVMVYRITLQDVSDSIQQKVYARKNNFAKMNVLVSPAENAVEEADTSRASWIEAGMNANTFDRLNRNGATALQADGQLLIAFEKQVRQSMAQNTDNTDIQDSPCPPNEYYNEKTGECHLCDVSRGQYWDVSAQRCITCETPKTWDGAIRSCVCPTGTYGSSCEPCESPREWRNNKCQCAADKPLFDEENNRCIECLSYRDCPIGKPSCNTDTHVCESCGTQKIFDTSTDQCVCNPSMYETDEDGRCVCKTKETLEQQIDMAATWQAGEGACRTKMADFGKLKGTYYFKWVEGFLIYNGAWTKSEIIRKRRLGAKNIADDFVGKPMTNISIYVMEGDIDRGLIFNVTDYLLTEFGCCHTFETLEAELRTVPIKYFTFDGTKDIWLEFRDQPCSDNDNSSTMKVELRRVIDYCEM